VRLWSIHPKYLDPKGLVALWREALLAQAVLAGETRGYTRHPQLERFRRHSQPSPFLARYLHEIWNEASRRGYSFDASKIPRRRSSGTATVTRGQLLFEWNHLRGKLETRNPAWLSEIDPVRRPECHPAFVVVDGPIEEWERGADRNVEITYR
jgi:pyrimidine dimer DNA glycosylase